MPDYKFIENPFSKKWVIMAPRRAKRPNEASGVEPVCPFCPGNKPDGVLYQVGEGENWKVLVIPNKFPFAPHHEIIIHSQDHHKGFDELPITQTKLILETYRQRYNFHKSEGQVYIFHNHGAMSGESLPHPHSQLVVVPKDIKLDIQPLEDVIEPKEVRGRMKFG